MSEPKLISLEKSGLIKLLRDLPKDRVNLWQDDKNPDSILLVIGKNLWDEFKEKHEEECGGIR